MSVGVDTKYVYEVQIDVNLTRYEICRTVCPVCGAAAEGELPQSLSGTQNYGNVIRSLAVALTQYACVGIDKTRKILRDLEGSAAAGVLPGYEGILVHDCWKPYFGFDKCEHALCAAHLLRELNALIEQGQLWTSEMKGLLLEMKDVVDRYKNEDKSELSSYCRAKFEKRYDEVLEQAEAEIVRSAVRKKSKAENLLIRLRQYRAEITLFTANFDVPFDNNQAERDIRNIKVKQKVSGGFRTFSGARDYANTASVIGIALKHGLSVFKFIKNTFDGHSNLLEGTTE